MIDHHGFGHDRWGRGADKGSVHGVHVDQHRPGDPVVGPHRVRRPVLSGRARPVRLVKDRGSVHRFCRHRRQPDPNDTAGIPVHRDRQFDLNPPKRDRVQSEDIEPRGVHQHVLARPGRAEFSVHPIRAVGDVAIAFGAQPERRMLLLQFRENTKRRSTRRNVDDVLTEPSDNPSVGPLDDHRLRRSRLVRMFDHHFNCGFSPPRVDIGAQAGRLSVARRCKPCFTVLLELLNPPLHRTLPDTEFVCLTRVAFRQRHFGSVLRSWLLRERHFFTARTKSGEHLANVRSALHDVVAFTVTELSENNPSNVDVVIATWSVGVRNHACAL